MNEAIKKTMFEDTLPSKVKLKKEKKLSMSLKKVLKLMIF